MKTFTLSYPPSGNRYWRHFRGITCLSAEARAYRKTAGMEAIRQGVEVLGGPVVVGLVVYRPRRMGDLDNTSKVLLDALNGIAWNDDSQIVELHLYRFDDKNNPRVEVTIVDKSLSSAGEAGE